MIHDSNICHLGEGPLWHPEREELFWFDILGRTLHVKGRQWRLERLSSAAGWIDRDSLLVASENALSVLDLASGSLQDICPLEADNPVTRSNDGRADPQGGFWIGTMGKGAEKDAGSIWRYYRGELRRIIAPITITNAISFAPDGTTAYYADTDEQVIRAIRLDRDGWPVGESRIHVDLRGTPHHPDGAVVDAEGNIWSAQWGSFRVAGYDLQGQEIGHFAFPAAQTSCPAFGGPDLTRMFCTSAAAGLGQSDLIAHPDSGRTFVVETGIRGQAEHRVIL